MKSKKLNLICECLTKVEMTDLVGKLLESNVMVKVVPGECGYSVYASETPDWLD